MLRSVALCAGLFASGFCHPAPAAEANYQFDGHTKARVIVQQFPDNSVFNSLTGSRALDLESELRLNFQADRGPWSANAAWQLLPLYGDRIEYSRLLPPDLQLVFNRLPNDERRLFQLTDVIQDAGKFALVQRIDRLWFGYSSEKSVLRIGRQAISWGNGLFFSPMDIVNPFDPAAIDTEYKAGDDMLYGQHLRANGHDTQAAIVVRRNIQNGEVEADEGTAAVKYHGISESAEYDFLLAQSFGEFVVGIGGNRSIGGAVWRGDLVLSDSAAGAKPQFVTNFSHSWVWRGRNMSGVVEYFFNGFGQSAGRYSPDELATNPELLKRLARGEIFTLGRHYLAGGVSVEMTPLWLLTPNLFVNLQDPSAFLQLVTQNNLSDNATFLGALSIPLGPDGSEYGGIEAGTNGQYVSTDFGIFAQIAWYF